MSQLGTRYALKDLYQGHIAVLFSLIDLPFISCITNSQGNLIYTREILQSVVVVRQYETRKERQSTAKELLQEMVDENREVYTEIAEFVALLQEFGVTSYKLTGSLQEPIITSYSLS